MKILPNPLRTHKTTSEKRVAYHHDINASNGKIMADKSDGTSVLLKNLSVDMVEFIGGRWRVQEPTDCTISHIRDLDLIIGEKLPRQENTFFEYYRAKRPVFNCYGLITMRGENIIVAKYTTPSGVIWGYGDTIESARAFLGIKLYDMYKDLIHSVLCAQTPQNQK